MYSRTILSYLAKWACSEHRKPLIVRGARQVGKTYAVRMFGRSFDTFVELNLDRAADAALFEKGLSAAQVLQAALLHKNIRALENGRILLFIDEIQNSAAAMDLLRFFLEDLPDLHVIAAGSLLEAMIAGKHLTIPVGRVHYCSMYPLTFAEFLEATGASEAARAYAEVPCPDFAIETIRRLFHDYALVGGMPEIVAAYAGSGTVAGLDELYSSLVRAYEDDVAKYATGTLQVAVLKHCIETAPLEAGTRVTFARFGRSDYRSREIGEALRALERAMLLYLCYPATAVEPPAQPDPRKSPRLQYIDTGLLNYVAGIQAHYTGVTDLNSLYRGLLAEHVAGQEILALGVIDLRKPLFWVRESPRSNAQVDYLLPWNGFLIPVEVKSGATGSLRSLHQFMDACPHDMAVRLWAGTLELVPARTIAGKPFRLLNLPYCFAGLLPRYLDWAFGGK